MNLRTLILRSLRFHWRGHLGVWLGAAVGSAALIGALVVGDSVRESLKELALQRLGDFHFAMDTGDHLFQENLRRQVQASINEQLHGSRAVVSNSPGLVQRAWFSPDGLHFEWTIPTPLSALLRLNASAATQDGSTRANHVQLFGIDEALGLPNGSPLLARIPPDAVVLN